MDNVSPRQMTFVKEYLVDLNGTQAAIRSGYSKKTAAEQASRLLSNVKITQLINKAMDQRAKKVGLSAEYVVNGVMRVIERCEQAEPVRDKEGNPTGEYKFEANAALKGYELLGRHLKLFTDRIEHSGTLTLEALVAGSNRLEGK